MRWRRVREDDGEAIRRFLAEREDLHVASTARYLESDSARDCAWIASDDEIRAFAFLGSGGAFLPVFTQDLLADRRAHTVRAVTRCLTLHRVRSVQATAQDAAVAEEALLKLGRVASDSVDYALMGLEGKPSAASLGCGPEGLVITQATRADADALFPLQAAYEREEVIPQGGDLNLAGCRLALERTLASRIVLYAVLDGLLVGKANTNARSYTRDQIGGVYVLEAYRGRGIGTRLVAELVALLAERSRAASLFVKKRNRAAITAYDRIGFDIRGDYRISYY
jgi:GNAT superfamily N-acetyltransferase